MIYDVYERDKKLLFGKTRVILKEIKAHLNRFKSFMLKQTQHWQIQDKNCSVDALCPPLSRIFYLFVVLVSLSLFTISQ